MKRLLVFIWAFAPLLAFATDETCPAGYYPAEYAELEYIESTGTQYIDTGIKPSDITTIIADFAFTNSSLRNCAIVYALDTSPLIYNYIGEHSAFNGFGENWGDDTRGWTGFKVPHDTNRHIWKVDTTQFKFYLDDSLKATQSNGVLADDTLKIASTGFTAVSNGTLGRFYSVKFKSGDTPLRDFIPVRRVSDGAVGMYDKVEGKFYGNSGTGEFIAGPEIAHDTITTQHHICEPCPANTYKPNTGNTECTKCPTGTFSPIASTSRSDCAKILRINDYVVYMPLGKRTEHGLCVMWNDEKYCADVYKKQ